MSMKKSKYGAQTNAISQRISRSRNANEPNDQCHWAQWSNLKLS